MEKNIKTRLHEADLELFRHYAGQMPVDEAGKVLHGIAASKLLVKKFIKIIDRGITIAEARESLKGVEAPHLDEVLGALNMLGEQGNQKDKVSQGK